MNKEQVLVDAQLQAGHMENYTKEKNKRRIDMTKFDKISFCVFCFIFLALCVGLQGVR